MNAQAEGRVVRSVDPDIWDDEDVAEALREARNQVDAQYPRKGDAQTRRIFSEVDLQRWLAAHCQLRDAEFYLR